jgi:outer membrane biosynthesis protein TonB
MSKNKDLSEQLRVMREKARLSSSSKIVPPPAAPTPTPEPVEAKPAPKLEVVPSQKPKAPAKKTQGRGVVAKPKAPQATLERTSITLKSSDSEALSEIQSFLMKRGRKAASTSTLLRLAVSYTRKALSSDADSLIAIYTQILEEDGRRSVSNG